MNFDHLVSIIAQTSSGLKQRALTSINQALVIRNWLVGYYLVEYEQKGEDRAKYGKKLLESIARELKKKKMKGMSFTNLKLFRQFYEAYPLIGQALPDQLEKSIQQALPVEFKIGKSQALPDLLEKPILQPPPEELIIGKQQPVADEFKTAPESLLTHFTFTHFTELIKIGDPLKRAFYEKEAIKGNWSSRQLKRQIESLLIERMGLSTDKESLLKSVQDSKAIVSIEDTIKDPYILEFTGFKELPVYSENDLETELLDKIEDFLMELGNGFCFEARQKRITIGNEHDRIDLVFYQRIIKCHVLIDLKTRAFSHADVGQMNYYLNYYKKNIMEKADRPPVGIVLCTDKEETKVEYATAGLDNKLFVSKYLVELPARKELEALIRQK